MAAEKAKCRVRGLVVSACRMLPGAMITAVGELELDIVPAPLVPPLVVDDSAESGRLQKKGGPHLDRTREHHGGWG